MILGKIRYHRGDFSSLVCCIGRVGALSPSFTPEVEGGGIVYYRQISYIMFCTVFPEIDVTPRYQDTLNHLKRG
jgi:hypothetical protein